MHSSYGASWTRISTLRPTEIAILTSASGPKRSMRPRIKSATSCRATLRRWAASACVLTF